ncbi:P-loop containing nucleoside triphosphate hydrolase protein [Saccharata proteae CBS 121410]|uniref:P-loop containing nucleoside triphosphate hydrolase protein n=1 Tax=Saccharata proteae CBS 121410 TaxID=1314787 RepID=A0A6A5YC11_9PEZI|nr:P-loop containing nucleoside triphosphate hydrolase protein [Saccharata proteae CBS 121410]
METNEAPVVKILILGDAEVGKSTFLSRLSLGRSVQNDAPPPYTLPVLRDLDQPFAFDIRMYNRPYRFEFYDTAAPTHYTLLQPNFIILAYDISRRSTLQSLQETWAPLLNGHFNLDEQIPVMVVGLKRDLRREWTEEEKASATAGGSGRGESVMPQEGLGMAQALRCDRYAECSALTGELCRQVLEDVAKTAAMTTTERGGLSQGGCVMM